MRIWDRLSGVTDGGFGGTHSGSILNAVLRSPSLAKDGKAICDNQYNADLSIE